MATNVLDFHRYTQSFDANSRLEKVTIFGRDDVASAARALESEIRACGLQVMAWHDLGTLEQMRDSDGSLLNCNAFGWSESDLTQFQDMNHALRSPLLRACRVESEAFWMNRRAVRTRGRNYLLEAIGLEDFELRSLVKAAIVVPVHMPFGQIGAAVLTSQDPAQTDLTEEFLRFADPLSGLIRRFLTGYVRTHRDKRYMPIEGTLTSRQIQCLRWAALGKTDWEIGAILGFSHAGVRYHLSRAAQTLGATNRAQSIYHACQLGYLGSVE